MPVATNTEMGSDQSVVRWWQGSDLTADWPLPISVLVWVKIHRHFLQQKCSPKNLLFSDILFIAIFTEVTENECVTENHSQIT